MIHRRRIHASDTSPPPVKLYCDGPRWVENVLAHRQFFTFSYTGVVGRRAACELSEEDTVTFYEEIVPRSFSEMWHMLTTLTNELPAPIERRNPPDLINHHDHITVADIAADTVTERSFVCATAQWYPTFDWFAELRQSTLVLHALDDEDDRAPIVARVVSKHGVVLESIVIDADYDICANLAARWILFTWWLDVHARDRGFATDRMLSEQYNVRLARCGVADVPTQYSLTQSRYYTEIGAMYRWIATYVEQMRKRVVYDAVFNPEHWRHAAECIFVTIAYRFINKMRAADVLLAVSPAAQADGDYVKYRPEIIRRWHNFRTDEDFTGPIDRNDDPSE